MAARKTSGWPRSQIIAVLGARLTDGGEKDVRLAAVADHCGVGSPAHRRRRERRPAGRGSRSLRCWEPGSPTAARKTSGWPRSQIIAVLGAGLTDDGEKDVRLAAVADHCGVGSRAHRRRRERRPAGRSSISLRCWEPGSPTAARKVAGWPRPQIIAVLGA